MKSIEFHRRLWSVVLLVFVACARGPGAEHDPRPSRVIPADGLSTGPVSIVIEGENFLALATQQLGGGAPLEVDSRFEVRLGDTRLEDVVMEDERHLRAVVPSGLATGWHSLSVVSPLGRRAVLPNAYFSTDRTAPRLEAQAHVERATLAVGQQGQLVLEVTNLGQRPAREVSPELVIEGGGQVVIVSGPSPADVGPAERVAFSWTLRAEAPGEVRLSTLARGRDAELERLVEVSAAPVSLSTRAPAALQARVVPGVERVSVGQEFSVELEVHNTGQSLARAVRASAEVSGLARVLESPESADIPSGERRSFSWRYRAEAPGTGAFMLSASGTEELAGSEVRAGPLASPSLTVQRAAALSAGLVAPAQASVGQEVSVSLLVTNTGEATAEAVEPVLEVPSGLEVVSQPALANLVGGESRAFTWTLRAQAPGTVSLVASASGTDANLGTVGSSPSLRQSLTVQRAGSLSGTVSVTPAQVSVGQPVTVELRVRNDGEAAVRVVTASMPVTSGGGGLQLRTLPSALALLPGGAEHSFTWTYEATAAGQVQLTVGASGTETNLGTAVELPALTSAPVTVQRPSSLTVAWAPVPERLNVGNVLKVSLTVTNTGEALARTVTPVAPTVTGAATLVSGPTPASLELAGGESGVFSWEYRASAEGTLTFQSSATGTDGNTGAALSAPVATAGPVTVQRPAFLVGTPPAPSRLNIGQSLSYRVEVSNTGTSAASAVKPSSVGLSGPGLVEELGEPDPTSADIPGGEKRTFRRTVKGVSEGTLRLSVTASGTDAVDGSPVGMAAVDVPLEVQRPAALTASMVAPASVGVGAPFLMTLTVTNTGGANVTGVTPDSLSCTDTAGLVVRGTPSGAGGPLAGGGSTTFSWELSASRPGTFRCSSVARGLDANDARAVASALATSNEGVAMEVTQLAVDPLGDGSAFSFVFRYDGRVYLGPNRTGRGGARMGPDGSGGETFTWLLPADTTGSVTSNSKPPPYPSIGATGCAKDSYDCGPDNENGRGVFFAGVLEGQEWLGLVGANSGGDLDYAWLTRDTDARLDFRYVDLNKAPTGPGTRGTSAAFFFHDRLYLGFPDTGGSRPYFVVLKRAPSVAPGLDAENPLDAENLEADKMPWLGKSATPGNTATVQMIEAMAALNDRLYVANNGGCIRSTTTTPQRYDNFPGDWAPCTPSLAAWTNRVSTTTTKTADLEPADKAVPRMAVFGGRLYLARNTTAGPQLFVCTPGTGGNPTQCDAGDWSLVAPNTRAGQDSLLTQFDNPSNTSLALLVATEKHLYLGFNNTQDGVVLLRSEGLTPSTQADFRGAGACLASQHAGGGCQGLGRNGLGVTTVRVSRLFDGVALTFGGADFVYVTAGDGSAPVRLFRVTD